jgi:hypothetical protein
VATPVTFVLVLPGQFWVRFCGNIKDGGVISWTVIVWTQLALLPQASVAVQVREMTLALPQVLLTESL